MAKLGGMFLTCALGPVNYAGSCIMANRVPEALRELSPDSLTGGVERGVDQLAKRVGLPKNDVATVLPQHEMQPILQRLATSHKNACDAWGFYASGHGGLLQGVADLTIDGRPPDAALCLERLAKKVSRDKPFSLPLKALAEDLAAWQELIHKCRAAIDDGSALAAAYRRRRMRTYAIAIVLGLLLSFVAITMLRYRAARARVDDALANDDACVVDAIDPSDLAKASAAQEASIAKKKEACAQAKAMIGALDATLAKAKADVDAAEKAKAEHEAKCDTLASHLESGALDDADRALAGDDASALFDRMMKNRLQGADFGPTDPPMPCGDTKAKTRLYAAYLASVGRSFGWVRADDISPAVKDELAKQKNNIKVWPRRAISVRAESTAKRAIVAGDPELVAKAVRLCDVAVAIEAPVGAACKKIGDFLPKKP